MLSPCGLGQLAVPGEMGAVAIVGSDVSPPAHVVDAPEGVGRIPRSLAEGLAKQPGSHGLGDHGLGLRNADLVRLVDQVGGGPRRGGQRLVEGLSAEHVLDEDREVLDAGLADAADQLGDVLAALLEGRGEGLGQNQRREELGEALDAERRQMGRQLVEVIRRALVGVEDPIVADQVVEQVVGGAQILVPAKARDLARLEELRPERLVGGAPRGPSRRARSREWPRRRRWGSRRRRPPPRRDGVA